MLLLALNKFILLALSGALIFVFGGGKNNPTSPSNYILRKYLARAEPVASPVRTPPLKPVYVTLKSPPSVAAESVYIGDVRSSGALREENSERPMPIASLTKLMTALVAAGHGFDPEETVTIHAGDRVAGNVEYFFPEDQLSFKDLLAAALMASSNTAANVIAKHVGDKFVDLMNEQAHLMILPNTHFTDPTGIDPGNVSTAKEAARIAIMAFGRPEISEILTKESYEIIIKNTGRKVELTSTNRLLGSELDQGKYKIMGGKTGYLDESGYNLALRVLRGGDEIIIIILGSKSKMSRFAEAKELALWAFQNFRWP